MSLPIRLLPEAKDEFDVAVDWYEKHAGLGSEFIKQARQVLDRIAAMPRIHGIVYQDVRKALVKRFPYIVLYREEPTEIIVIAVFHTSRNPTAWQSRL